MKNSLIRIISAHYDSGHVGLFWLWYQNSPRALRFVTSLCVRSIVQFPHVKPLPSHNGEGKGKSACKSSSSLQLSAHAAAYKLPESTLLWLLLGFIWCHKSDGGSTLKQNTVIRVSRLFVLCISLVFGGKYMEFRIIFSLQYSISINTFEVDPPSDSLHNAVVKPKNRASFLWLRDVSLMSTYTKTRLYSQSHLSGRVYYEGRSSNVTELKALIHVWSQSTTKLEGLVFDEGGVPGEKPRRDQPRLYLHDYITWSESKAVI
jgi:hypothetical protein